MRKALWVVLVVVALATAGCGPAAQPATGPSGGEVFVIALPRIVIDANEQGDLSILGVRLADVASILGQDPAAFRMDQALVSRMMTGNVQHIEVRQMGDRLAPFVNSKPLPHIGWTDESLDQAATIAEAFEVQNINTIRNALPIVRRLGLDIAVRFPRGAAAEIPLVEASGPAQQAAAPTEPPSVIARFEVKYNEQGVPAILGISADELAAMGISVGANMDPAMLQRLQSKDIQNLEINGKPSGLTIYTNGNPLPGLVWDKTSLANAIEFYSAYDPSNQLMPLIEQLLPVLSNPDIAILVHVPPRAGATPIPAKMH